MNSFFREQEHFERYRLDRSDESFRGLVEAIRPYVRSVCQSKLAGPDEVEWACQEVYIKLSRHADKVHGNLMAWLARVSRNACYDLIRAKARERQNRARYARDHVRPDNGVLTWEAALRSLRAALRDIDPATRDLIIQRFLQGRRLKDIASAYDSSVATISRRVTAAIRELRDGYGQTGFDGLEDLAFGQPLSDLCGVELGATYLRRPQPAGDAAHGGRGPEGWARPIRVGVLVSRRTSVFLTPSGHIMPPENQVWWTRLLADPRYEWVGLVEPETAHTPVVERTLRDFDLTDGLLEVTDGAGLETLDVIYFGNQYSKFPQTMRAVHKAVSGGVGLYRQGDYADYPYFGDYFPFTQEGNEIYSKAFDTRDDPLIYDQLKLAQTSYGMRRGSPAHDRCVAVVKQTHPIFPGLNPGDTFSIQGGWVSVHTPMAGSQVLIEYVEPGTSSCTCECCRRMREAMPAEALPISVACVGQIGRGRVVTINPQHGQSLVEHPKLRGNYLENIINWLAEPRRA